MFELIFKLIVFVFSKILPYRILLILLQLNLMLIFYFKTERLVISELI